MPSYLTPNWPAPKNIICFSTQREGGHSQGGFDSFNLAHHVDDHPLHVKQNRQQLKQDWQLPENILWLNQTHSTRVTHLDNPDPSINADAAITQQVNTPCAVLTADCLPILLCNQQGSEVAAIHAGWRGLRDGIIGNTINKMQSPSNQIMAWFGPALSPDGFEVSKEIKQQFLMIDPKFRLAFTSKQQHIFASLQILASQQLQQAGITAIYESNAFTDLDPKNYYSYRDNKLTGRMATVIAIGDTAP